MRHWTAEEIACLKERWPTETAREISRHIDRTVEAIQHKASRLGLEKESKPVKLCARDDCDNPLNGGRKYCSRRCSTLVVNAQQPNAWTPKEIAYLRRCYPHNTAHEVAAVLGRTPSSVSWKASELKIRTAPSPTRLCQRDGCDNHLTPNQKYYCSKVCRGLAERDPAKRSIFTCKWCEQEFEDWTYRQPTFCSNQCRSEYAARQPKPAARKPENFVTLTCDWCGDDYTVHECQARLRNSRFCSNKCKHADTANRMRGEGNPNYIHGESNLYPGRGANWGQRRRQALERDNYKCRICHALQTDDATLDVHHIRPYRKFDDDWRRANRLSNLVTLCRQCHVDVELGRKTCPLPF